MIDKTMIERLAEKLWEINAPEMAPSYDSLDADDQVKVQMIVDALLREMLEPTKEMIEAGRTDSLSTKGYIAEPAHVKFIWSAMIRAALED